MSNFKINVEINAPAIAEAITLLASAIAYGEEYKGENEPLKKEVPVIETKAETAKVETEVIEQKTTIEEIRALVTAKAKTKKEQIKVLLAEYGAKNVTVLAKGHYDEFYKKLGEI